MNDNCEKLVDNANLWAENQKLQSNWNSLREFVENEVNEDWDFSTGERDRYEAYDNVLDKMNELEGKDKE